jgi:glutamate dehydrogenase (NAD(P)+)
VSGFDDVNYYFRQAARIMDLSPHVERMLVTPLREVKVDVSITLDNGELGTFFCWRRRTGRRRRGPTRSCSRAASPCCPTSSSTPVA